MSKSNDLLGLS